MHRMQAVSQPVPTTIRRTTLRNRIRDARLRNRLAREVRDPDSWIFGLEFELFRVDAVFIPPGVQSLRREQVARVAVLFAVTPQP